MKSSKNKSRGLIIVIVLLLMFVSSLFIWIYFSPTVPINSTSNTITFSSGIGTSSYNISYNIYYNNSTLKYSNSSFLSGQDNLTINNIDCGESIRITLINRKMPFPNTLKFRTSFSFVYDCEVNKLVRTR